MRKKLRSILTTFGFHIEQETELFFDAVCGMEILAVNARYRSDHNGETYYFCSPSCKSHFDSDPEKYAGS